MSSFSPLCDCVCFASKSIKTIVSGKRSRREHYNSIRIFPKGDTHSAMLMKFMINDSSSCLANMKMSRFVSQFLIFSTNSFANWWAMNVDFSPTRVRTSLAPRNILQYEAGHVFYGNMYMYLKMIRHSILVCKVRCRILHATKIFTEYIMIIIMMKNKYA